MIPGVGVDLMDFGTYGTVKKSFLVGLDGLYHFPAARITIVFFLGGDSEAPDRCPSLLHFVAAEFTYSHGRICWLFFLSPADEISDVLVC